jgi:hypothetical protein
MVSFSQTGLASRRQCNRRAEPLINKVVYGSGRMARYLPLQWPIRREFEPCTIESRIVVVITLQIDWN